MPHSMRTPWRFALPILLSMVLWLPILGQEAPEIGVETGLLLGMPEGRPMSGAELERVTAEISDQVRCPMCRGLPISSSPTGAAQDMVIEVRELLSKGYTPDQIYDYFERTYGEFVLLDPKTRENWGLYVAPIVMLLLGGGIVGWRLMSNADEAFAESEEDPELAEYAAQVRAETSQEGPSS